MKGDFSRVSFDPSKNFTRVFMQQGRVIDAADINEEVSIQSHQLRTFVKDLLGPYGGPRSNCGFGIITTNSDESNMNDEQKKAKAALATKRGDFLIGPGNYYVDGILSVNPELKLYSQQGDRLPLSSDVSKYLIYIAVWERHVTHVEDPSIQEVALNGADTCTRAKLEWQVQSWPITEGLLASTTIDIATLQEAWENVKKQTVDPPNRGRLKVHLRDPSQTDSQDPSTLPPESRYRGSQNQLYRVEIHRAGNVSDATFKWSRENGSVIFPLERPMEDSRAVLTHLGKGRRFGLQVGDWVELVDADAAAKNLAEPLWRVAQIDSVEMQITLASADASSPTSTTTGHDMKKRPYLRRWDQKPGDARRGGSQFVQGAVAVTEGKRLPLENGIEIEFVASGATYRTGDYWLIPARVATGGIDWPTIESDAERRAYADMPPRSHYHYAPLAIVEFGPDGKLKSPTDMRAQFAWWAGPLS